MLVSDKDMDFWQVYIPAGGPYAFSPLMEKAWKAWKTLDFIGFYYCNPGKDEL